jgi:hypothetical protein
LINPDPSLKRGLYAYKPEAVHREAGWYANYDSSGVLTAHRASLDDPNSYTNNTDEDESAGQSDGSFLGRETLGMSAPGLETRCDQK